jgi:DNA helicase-2/ATP-dependent DNA helicase PcrA
MMMIPEIAQAIEADVSFLRILGGAGTGKTSALIERVKRFVESGCDPARILVVVTNRNALESLRGRLEAAAADGAVTSLRMSTIQDLCLDILGTPEAVEATGRIPRIINSMEEIFLLEDLKLIGIRPGRIREILKFFYREWTEFGDEKDEFLQDSNEADLHTAITAHLRERGAMMPSELSAVTYRYLRDHEQTPVRQRFEHVLVDDYQNLNKASQGVAFLLASQTLTITGNPYQTQACRELYPWPQGLSSFVDEVKDCKTVVLTSTLRCPQRIVAAGNALVLAEQPDTLQSVAEYPNTTAPDLLVTFDDEVPLGELTVVEWADPAAEREGIAAAIAKRLVTEPDSLRAGSDPRGEIPDSPQGELDPLCARLDPLRPSDILVVVFNRTWGRLFARQLDRLSVPHEDWYADNPLSGNPQNLETSSGMRSYTALTLVAHPDDIVAWRSWCGFGDYLANSALWNRLILYANQCGIDVLQALREVAEGVDRPFSHAEVLAEAYQKGWKLLAHCKGRTGADLIDALRQGDDASFEDFKRLLEPVDEGLSATDLYERARLRFVDPWFQTNDRVRVASLTAALGVEAKLVVLLGLVDGFIPSSATFGFKSAFQTQDRQRVRERRALYNILSRSSGEVILSSFQKCDVETAERLSMEIRRIRVESGRSTVLGQSTEPSRSMAPGQPLAQDRRVALLSVSQFVEEIREALPAADGSI